MRIRLPIGTALLTVALVAGCSSTGPTPHPAPQPDTIPVIRPPEVTASPRVDHVAGLHLPIEAYMMRPEQLRMSSAAFSKVLGECMRSFGFTDPVEPSVAYQPSLMARRYGLTDPVNAARFGYHTAPGEDRTTTLRPALTRQLSAREQAVSFGYPDDKVKDAANEYRGRTVPAGGCHGEAQRRVGFDLIDQADPDNVVNQIASASLHQSESDSRVVKVLQRWSSCMASQGFRYDSPVGMADHDEDLAESFHAQMASAREIRVARADVACKRRHNVVGVWFAVETAYQRTMIKQNESVLDGVRSAVEGSLRACAEIGA